MGIFTRRRTVVADAIWQPEDDEIEVADGAEMDDDGCASEEAYGVTFMLEDNPYASLTIWAYISDAGRDDPGDYVIGYRCDYREDDADGDEPWTAAEYGTNDEFYDDWDACDHAARAAAEALAAPRHAQTLRGTLRTLSGAPGCIAGFLEWDGVPWS